jgi:hypothetical protein
MPDVATVLWSMLILLLCSFPVKGCLSRLQQTSWVMFGSHFDLQLNFFAVRLRKELKSTYQLQTICAKACLIASECSFIDITVQGKHKRF